MDKEIKRAIDEMTKVVKGKDHIVKKVLAAILAKGHILLEDIPGVGKTTLAMTISKTLDLKYKRMQFTPDVLPSDLIGFSMYNEQTREFEYRPGTVFCNLFLADEINRTSPKTQSALLEVMEEGRASVDGVTHELPNPFIVIATQNPAGSSGTQMLPDSQLDRFMICLSMGYPSHEAAVDILRGYAGKPKEECETILTEQRLRTLQQETEEVYVSEEMLEYLVTLSEKTRISEQIKLGASPRGTISLLKMSKAIARMEGRDFVAPEDTAAIFTDVLAHRMVRSAAARMGQFSTAEILEQIFQEAKQP